ncbi:FG-GAP repeat domain-containing protein [Streptomyces spectabilis]|uniref:VCBS repeat-containing protein n=1 Tax=Streptomyces spectabilis TaxID=68270 RepID=A0A516R2G5_STRST|nr:VCBS repeat-containing protein [Streptomyces spectabilis]QDQ09853.1 VCBS repeat-containing protein [Streptomyces spectabilis]
MTMQSRALLGSALAPVLALAVAAPSAHAAEPKSAPGAPRAAAAAGPAEAAPRGPVGPWTAPAELPGVTQVHDLKTNRGGTVVGLFTQDGKSVVALRPAGSTSWQPARPAEKASLHRTDDGSISLLTWEEPGDGGPGTLRVSRLGPDATSFGPAETVPTAGPVRAPVVAGNAAGRTAVAWMDGERRLTVTEQSGPGAEWTAPVALDQLPEPIERPDHTYDYRLRDLRLALAVDGTVAVLWGGNSFYDGDGVHPDPTAYKWHYTYLEKPAGSGSWSAPRELPQLGEKPDQVTLAAHPRGGFHLLSHDAYARKAAGADWGTAEPVAVGSDATRPAELHTAPNGDVTAVGRGAEGPHVATLRAATGRWTEARLLDRSVADDSVSSARTATGALVVTYTRKRYTAGSVVRTDFVTQTVGDHGISKPRVLSAPTDGRSSGGRVTADGQGRPVAVWTETDGRDRRTFTATTGKRALPKWHDFADDAKADLIGISTTGALNLFTQDGSPRPFQLRTWPEKTRLVPFGDFDGDRCNDVVARMPGGETRLYTPVCDGMPLPESPYKKLARDWSKYDTLVAAGDQTGDGRPDLLARDKATGHVYLYAHDGRDGFAPRVKIRSSWTGYQRVIGAGDLNGDGIGDVLALDKSGELWRYDGTRAGRLKDRVRVFKDWGASYKDVIGAGDVNGDGKHDLVARDTSNRLWLNAGSGRGTFAGRTQFGEAPYWKQWASIG